MVLNMPVIYLKKHFISNDSKYTNGSSRLSVKIIFIVQTFVNNVMNKLIINSHNTNIV